MTDEYDADDVQWDTGPLTVQGGVIYDDTPPRRWWQRRTPFLTFTVDDDGGVKWRTVRQRRLSLAAIRRWWRFR